MAEMGELSNEDHYFSIARPGSYAGVDKYYRAQTGASRRGVRSWLSGEESYSLHHPVRYVFPRNQVVVSTIDSQWDVDLAVMTSYPDQKSEYSYFLLAVDILSHYVWTRALKTKKSLEVTKAMQSIFTDGLRKPETLRSDRGTEFAAKSFQKAMKKEGVKTFLTNNEVKANYAERAIRTIKLRLARFFTRTQSYDWVNALSSVTESYNSSYHRTIRRTPASVTAENASEVWQIQYGGPGPKPDGDFKLEVGALVRISFLKRHFQRDYSERWSGELFKVKARRRRGGLNVYELTDWLGESIQGLFYGPELQQVTVDPEGVFKIEKVLQTRKRRGHGKEFLIRWKYWPAKFDSWVLATDVTDI